MVKLFSAFNKKSTAKQPIIIVSGLPRSGTSMMMKMISEGGLQVITDEQRQADDDNPNGYFELEVVKEMANGKVTWVDEASGKAVKIISSLLEYLPPQHSYKIVFMERELNEILASQQKMLANRKESSKVEDAKMKRQFQDHLKSIKAWLIRQPNIDVMYVNFNTLIKNPELFCRQVAEFIDLPMSIENMLSVPNKGLYRNRFVR